MIDWLLLYRDELVNNWSCEEKDCDKEGGCIECVVNEYISWLIGSIESDLDKYRDREK